MQVCQAVQHAHQKGIIHRDLKPSNILVCLYDGQPVPKVIDFGLAKAMHQSLTEHTLYTAHGVMVGTPLYMSPEQAELNNLDIDTRTDVYSLGVILYELLTGTTPLEKQRFKDAAWQEMLRLIKEEEPPKPSTRLSGSGSLPSIAAQRSLEPAQLSRAVRGDLDWIVMKSLEKERSRRYETANGLARDIERYLHDEPVEACPPSAAYRFSKFAHRNRVALTTAVLVSAALVVGTVVSTWQAIRATRAERVTEAARLDEAEQRRIAEDQGNAANAARASEAEQRRIADDQRMAAENERTEADKQRAAAEANFQKARIAVDKYFTLVSESTLLDVPGLQPLRKDLLEAALQFYEGYTQERGSDPNLLVDLAVTYLRLGQVYLALDRTNDCVAATSKALDLVTRLRRDHPQAREQVRKLAGFWKGQRWAQGRLEMPQDTAAAWLAMLTLEATWKELASEYPAEVGFQVDLAMIQTLMGGLLSWNDRSNDANRYYRNAIAIGENLVSKDPTAPQYRADLAVVIQLLVNNLASTGPADDALALTRRAVQLGESLLAEQRNIPSHRSALASSLTSLGMQLARTDAKVAEQSFRRALELSELLVREFPGQPLFLEVWTKASVEWVSFEATAGNNSQAQKAAQELIEALDARINERPSDLYVRERLAIALSDLAERPAAKADLDLRGQLLERSRALFAKLASENPNQSRYLEWAALEGRKLGWLAHDKGQTDKARQSFEGAIDCFDRIGNAHDGFFRRFAADTRLELAYLLAGSGEAEAALKAVEQAVEAARSLSRDYPDNLQFRLIDVHAQSVLAHRLADNGKTAEAERAQQRATEALEKIMSDRPKDPQVRAQAAFALGELAEGLPRHMDLDLSEQLHRRKLALHQELAIEFPDQPAHLEFTGHGYRYLGWILRDKGQFEQARKSFLQAVEVFEKLAGDKIPQRDGFYRDLHADTLVHLVDTLAIEGRFEEAAEPTRRRVQMYDALVAEFPKNSDYFRKMISAHHAHALVQLRLENLPAYRAACEAMRERLAGSSDVESRHALAWTCALGPGALADLSTPLAGAKILVESAPSRTDYLTALSGMLYRDGRFEEAVERWNSADKVNAAQAAASGATLEGQFILAMAHHRLGHAEQVPSSVRRSPGCARKATAGATFLGPSRGARLSAPRGPGTCCRRRVIGRRSATRASTRAMKLAANIDHCDRFCRRSSSALSGSIATLASNGSSVSSSR